MDGFVEHDDSSTYPQGDYTKVDDIKIVVNTPHKPDFGTSPIKDDIIQAIEVHAQNACMSFAQGSEIDLWKNATIYIEDFYEYQGGVGVWILREDGYLWSLPILIENVNNEFNLVDLKGFAIFDFPSNKEQHFFVNRNIEDAIKQTTCNY